MAPSFKDITAKLKSFRISSFSLPPDLLPKLLAKLPFDVPENLQINLQRREKIIVYAGGVILGVLLILHVIIFPILDRRTNLRNQITSRTKELQEMQALKSEYESLTRDLRNNEAKLKFRSKGFTLFSFLDELAGKSGIKQNIENMKPSTSNVKGSPYTLSLVEMKINSLTMEQLVTFLHGVETSPNMIWIKRISISKGEKKGQLINSIIQVETFQL